MELGTATREGTVRTELGLSWQIIDPSMDWLPRGLPVCFLLDDFSHPGLTSIPDEVEVLSSVIN